MNSHIIFPLIIAVFTSPLFAGDAKDFQKDNDEYLIPTGVAVVGAGAYNHNDDCEKRTDCYRRAVIGTSTYAAVATLAICGLIGGWVGEHATHDCDTNSLNMSLFELFNATFANISEFVNDSRTIEACRALLMGHPTRQ